MPVVELDKWTDQQLSLGDNQLGPISQAASFSKRAAQIPRVRRSADLSALEQ